MWRLAALLMALALAAPAHSQDKAVKIVLGFPAGATSDLLSRIVAEHMRQAIGQPVIVENKPGAGGQIANESVKGSPADGSTLLMTPVATMSIYPHSYSGQLRYDPFKDFEPVAHLSDFQLSIGVSTKVPANTLADYVGLVKKDPKTYGFYASAAPGSIPHFLGVMFGRAAAIELTHVPYKGTAAVLRALAAGEIVAATTLSADIGTLVKGGKARLLAVAGAKRDPAFPDVPTFKESGYDMVGTGWYGLFAPAGTPVATIDRLSKAAIAAVKDPAVSKRMTDMGLEPTGYAAAELGRVMKADYDKWGPVIRASGFKPTQ